MNEKEELTKIDLENFDPVEDFVRYYEDYGFEFPIRAGHLLKIFSLEGYSVLGDRQ